MDHPSEDAWVESHRRLLQRWQSFQESSQPPVPISISRVNQFDAARLDVEMSGMLKEQLLKVFSLTKPGILYQYEAELDAFLEFLIWRFSIWIDKPTPGNALMNLRYRDELAVPAAGKEVRTGLEGPGLSVSQKIWYCLANVGCQYIWTRLQSFSAFRRWGDSEQRPLTRSIWNLIQHLEGVYKAAAFTNLLVFLYTGRYRTIIERALKARLVYGSPHMNRAVSFEYMNRQLVWNEFSEMLLLLLPLLNSASVKRFLLPFSNDKSASSDDGRTCPICQANPTIPFVALPCQHRRRLEELYKNFRTRDRVYAFETGAKVSKSYQPQSTVDQRFYTLFRRTTSGRQNRVLLLLPQYPLRCSNILSLCSLQRTCSCHAKARVVG